MGECWIFGAGSFYGLQSRPKDGDLVLAADGGLAHCAASGITPDWIIGDFDSLEDVPARENVIRLPVEKDDTDMLAAIRIGLERGCRTFRIYGGTGGKRPEHTIANLQCLLFLAKQDAVGWLYDENTVCTLLRNGSLRFPATQRGNISVFAMGGTAEGVTLRGLKYGLENAGLTPDFPLGVSNAFTGEDAEITVRNGNLLIWYDIA